MGEGRVRYSLIKVLAIITIVGWSIASCYIKFSSISEVNVEIGKKSRQDTTKLINSRADTVSLIHNK